MRPLTPFAVVLLLAPVLSVCVQAQVRVRPLRLDPVDAQHYVCVQARARARQLRAEVASIRRELRVEHRALAERKKTLDQDRRDLDDITPPTIDYSRYNWCPNKHPWQTCDHDSLKSRWLAEQRGQYNRRKMDLRDKVARELSAYLRDLGVFRTRLENLQRKEDELEDAGKALARELTRLRELARAEVQALNQKIEELERRRQLTRRALERIRDQAPWLEKSLDEWANLPEKARQEMWLTVVSQGLSLVLNKVEDHRKFPTQDWTRQALKDLEAKVFGTTEPRPEDLAKMRKLVEGLRMIQGKEQLIKYVQRLDKTLAGIGIAHGLHKRDVAEVGVEVAKLFINEKTLPGPLAPYHIGIKMGLADAEMLAAVGHAYGKGYLARQQVDILTTMSESQLIDVKKYSKVMINQTKQLNALRDRVRGLEAFVR
jgi:hypothetical protein